VRAVPKLCVVYPDIYLATEATHGKNLRLRDEIFGVFIREKVWFENSLILSLEGVKGGGSVRVEKQVVEWKEVPRY
jgi:hypothetical protein